jgi:serine phosphatase RsbU (regulator of sigma subunit)/pSer/pThr/pTyr-binding forkhead associated (FHA) protein
MAILLTLQGPESGRTYSLAANPTVLGRQLDCTICLDAKAVSRQHAQILCENGEYFVEDLKSSNGTFVNSNRITGKVPFTERDTLQIGPYVFGLRPAPTPSSGEANLVIREQVSAFSTNYTLFRQDATQKLQVILEISKNLARTLDLEPLLEKLLEQLLGLFHHADRGMVLLCEGDHLVVRAQRLRREEDASAYPYSRTIVKRALDEGVGILSDDVRSDKRFQASETIASLNMRSLLCVPLIAQDGKRLGIIQVDRFLSGAPFRLEDLQLLTAVALQASVVLENVAMHAELLREERFRQELAMARDIQQSFLPTEFDIFKENGFDLFARVHPARQVSGDLYDFFPLPDGRLAFFVGDVSGKGMPAALFMIAVRTLIRHLAPTAAGPADALVKLNAALAADNPSGMFVTLAHGIYTPETGEVVLALGGHPPPLLRRPHGEVVELAMQPGRLLGYEGSKLDIHDRQVALAPGETLVFYTDGFTEAREPVGRSMFGLERFQQVVRDFSESLSLQECVDRAMLAVVQFIRAPDLQDDLTLLLLRRLPGSKGDSACPKL